MEKRWSKTQSKFPMVSEKVKWELLDLRKNVGVEDGIIFKITAGIKEIICSGVTEAVNNWLFGERKELKACKVKSSWCYLLQHRVKLQNSLSQHSVCWTVLVKKIPLHICTGPVLCVLRQRHQHSVLSAGQLVALLGQLWLPAHPSLGFAAGKGDGWTSWASVASSHCCSPGATSSSSARLPWDVQGAKQTCSWLCTETEFSHYGDFLAGTWCYFCHCQKGFRPES